MEWEHVIDVAGVIMPVGVAVVVALMVSGRDDRRQRDAERRAVQRDTIIALQDAWLELDMKLTAVLHLIQRHQSVSKRDRAESKAERASLAQKETALSYSSMTFEQRVAHDEARMLEVNRTGDEMIDAVIDLREFARRIELLESRVSSKEVKSTSGAMREHVEAMIVDLGSQGGSRYGGIRRTQYQPAYDRFIRAGYIVLADLDRHET